MPAVSVNIRHYNLPGVRIIINVKLTVICTIALQYIFTFYYTVSSSGCNHSIGKRLTAAILPVLLHLINCLLQSCINIYNIISITALNFTVDINIRSINVNIFTGNHISAWFVSCIIS